MRVRFASQAQRQYAPPDRFFHRVVDDTVWIVAVWHGRQLPASPYGVPTG